jgi:WD40 repeat protein
VELEPIPEYLTLRGHMGAVTDVVFHPTDGRSLVSADTEGTVRVWDFRSGTMLGALYGPPSSFRASVAYSPNGRRLAAAGGSSGQPVRVWDIATEKEICNFPGHTDTVMCVAFSPDGGHVASVGFDFTVRVWDATTAKEARAFRDHNWAVLGVAFSPDGRHLASGSSDSTVRIWDWTTGVEVPALRPQHAGRVTSVAFSRDGKRLASASLDRTIKVREAESWQLLHDLSHPSGVQCVAFDRDGPRLAWGSTDGTVTVWDGLGRQPHVLRGHTSWVQAVAFSPDGKWIASASLDGTVKIWNAPPDPQPLEQETQDAEK